MSDIQLQIDKLKLYNFRNFQNLEKGITFDPKLTVIVAKNGAGKTAILDAVKIAFGTFTNAFPISTSASFTNMDAHVAPIQVGGEQYPVILEAEGIISNEPVRWERRLDKQNGRTTTKEAQVVAQYGEFLYGKTRDRTSDTTLPILAFYGTGRLWGEHRDRDDIARRSALLETRFYGYEKAFTESSNYKQVYRWLVSALKTELTESTIAKTEDGQVIVNQLKSVRTTVDQILGAEGWHGLHYDYAHEDLAILDKISLKNNEIVDMGRKATKLPISWQSDGVRAVFALVADIAFRCAKLNMHLGAEACKLTQGIVMIDEVDMFLHPAWQQHILLNLQNAFPMIQFIVTTHSPQVLSSVPRNCIRVISDSEIINASIETEGARAEQILEEVFGVDSRPSEVDIVKKLQEYRNLVAHGEWGTKRAMDLKDILYAKFDSDPELSRLAIDVKVQEYKRKNPVK